MEGQGGTGRGNNTRAQNPRSLVRGDERSRTEHRAGCGRGNEKTAVEEKFGSEPVEGGSDVASPFLNTSQKKCRGGLWEQQSGEPLRTLMS